MNLYIKLFAINECFPLLKFIGTGVKVIQRTFDRLGNLNLQDYYSI